MQSSSTFIMTILASILLFIGSVQIVSAQEAIFWLTPAVLYLHDSDDTYLTVLEVDVHHFSGGTLPDDIVSVIFEGPSGVIASLGDPRIEVEQSGNTDMYFWIKIPGEPEPGLYTFTVTSSVATGSFIRTASDTQTVIREILLPDETSFSPAPDAVLSSMTHTVFSWDPVSYQDVPLYYRWECQDAAGNRYSSPRTLDMTSFEVPLGYLQPGQSYSWRVRVTDADGWVTTENRSQNAWKPFTMAATLDHPAMPWIPTLLLDK